jgi:sporulation protein YlmC with PRC-barrel domain
MKTSLLFGVMLAVLGAAIASTPAQTQSTTVQASKLVGTKVKSSQGEEIGVVKEVMIDRSTGCMAYTVLSTGEGGARAVGGGKLVAVPWAVYSPTSDVNALTVTVDRERIYSAPVFDYARIDEYSRPDYITNVYSYYGVSPGSGSWRWGFPNDRNGRVLRRSQQRRRCSLAGPGRLTCSNHFAGSYKVTCGERVTCWKSVAESTRDRSKASRNCITARTWQFGWEPAG